MKLQQQNVAEDARLKPNNQNPLRGRPIADPYWWVRGKSGLHRRGMPEKVWGPQGYGKYNRKQTASLLMTG